MTEQIEQEFLKEILAQPQDDTVRLIYADWLEGHDQSERGEFIRVQCALARMAGVDPDCYRKQPFGRHWSTQGNVACAECWPHKEALLRLERELWMAMRPDGLWHVSIPFPLANNGEFFLPQDFRDRGPSSLQAVVLRRGFASEVVCRAEWWCGRECACTQPDRRREPDPACRLCQGLGQVDAHGPEVVGLAPLELVRFGDRRPHQAPLGQLERRPHTHRWLWTSADSLLELLPQAGLPCCLPRHMGFREWKVYASEAEAWSDQSQGALAWAKEMAKRRRGPA